MGNSFRLSSFFREKRWIGSHNCDVSDRDAAIEALKESFGEKKIIPITNYNAMQVKSLVKDMSRLHNVPHEEVNAVTRDLDRDVKPFLHNDDETKGAVQLTYEACVEHSAAFRVFVEQHPEVGADAQLLGRQPKSLGRHAGGVIVLDDPDSAMPLISVKREIQTPWSEGLNSKGLSPFGLCKYDILALGTLRMFERCIARILKRRHGVAEPTFAQVKEWYEQNLAPSAIDPADPVVFDRIFRGRKFAGIFQFTTPSTQQFLVDLDPRSVTDLAIATSIYRPGPLAADVDKLYVESKRTGITKDYGHPVVNEVLKDTSGYIIFQEQIQQIAMSLANFSEEDADRLRKAILKRTVKDVGKAKTITEELHDKFITGATANGYPEAKAEALYEDMRAFAKYAFNCLSGDSVVDTRERGKIKIDDVRPGEHVACENGYTKVLNQIYTGTKQVYRVKTKSGKTIKCTEDHVFATPSGNKTLKVLMSETNKKILVRK